MIVIVNIHESFTVCSNNFKCSCTYKNTVFQVSHKALFEPEVRTDAMQGKVRHVLRTVTTQQRMPKMINTGSTLYLITIQKQTQMFIAAFLADVLKHFITKS